MHNSVLNQGYDELRRASKEAKIAMRPVIFALHVQANGGYLPDELGAHACWYYARCAHINIQNVKDGAQYEGEIDHVNSLNNLARSIANLYNLKDGPADFLQFIIPVRMEAMRLGMPWDPRIEKPLEANQRSRGNG